MIFKKFKHIALFYLLGIILLTGVGVYIIFNTYFWLTAFWVFLFDGVLILVFLKYIGSEHKKLAHFLVSIDQNDFTPPYSKSYLDLNLNKAFDHLSEVIVSLRDEAQINYQYLQTVVNNINTALICVDKSDKIVLSNTAANKLFQKNVLRSLDSLKGSTENITAILGQLKDEEKKLVKFKVNGELCNYSIQEARFKIQQNEFRLYSFQNVQSELEQKELESWQKLTRVMAHEIMNSSIPISNLSGVVYNKLFNEGINLNQVDEDQENDIRDGLKTIESRSKGLVNFVEATRNFTKMPKPDLEEIDLRDLIKHVALLLKQKLLEKSIKLHVSLANENINVLADKSLIEQALINVLLNAIDAVDQVNNPKINIDAFINDENRKIIIIEDNGKGISDNDLENIFVPFYTTKRTGSGIGLSLTKQIMFLHKGNITVKSELDRGTKFIISF